MELILKWNLFDFHEATYNQQVGVAMGVPTAPNYADIFLAKRIDSQIWELVNQMKKDILENKQPMLLLLKRFLDDLFLIFRGTTKQLHTLLNNINKLHPTIKFTMTHTDNLYETKEEKCECIPKNEISFLDTSCSLEKGRIEVDLFRKESDRNQYLLTSSIHPPAVTKNIPFSLALRIKRTCTNPQQSDQRLSELKTMLLTRNYPEGLVDSAIERIKVIPRLTLLKKQKHKKEKLNRPIFAVSYDPRLPSISSIAAKHWRTMVAEDQHLKECFPEPPLIAHKRPQNLRESLIKAKVPQPPETRQKRLLKGMAKCGKSCTACPYVMEGRNIKVKRGTTWKINKRFTCNSYNVVYMLECSKENCRQRYIGETKRPMKHRLADHRGYIVNKHVDKATGAHFTLPGHTLADLRYTILEQVKKSNDCYRKEREKYFITKFDTQNKGLNRRK